MTLLNFPLYSEFNMTEENPYTTPSTDPIVAQPAFGQLQLATPGERFQGAFIDGLMGIAISIPFWGLLFLVGVLKSMEDMSNRKRWIASWKNSTTRPKIYHCVSRVVGGTLFLRRMNVSISAC